MTKKVFDIDSMEFEPVNSDANLSSSNIVTDSDIPEMFDTILDSLNPGSFRNTILDMQDYYERKGYLTRGQYDVVERAYFRSLRGE